MLLIHDGEIHLRKLRAKELRKSSKSRKGFCFETRGAISVTPLKTNMSPENQWLEDVFPTEIVPLFTGHVSFRGCRFMDHCYKNSMLLGFKKKPWTKKRIQRLHLTHLTCRGVFHFISGMFGGKILASKNSHLFVSEGSFFRIPPG